MAILVKLVQAILFTSYDILVSKSTLTVFLPKLVKYYPVKTIFLNLSK